MEYHVSINGNDLYDGSINKPFRTISKAASVADECDIVTVHGGEYRECVTVVRGARSENNRITFRGAENEVAVIKGSEEIKNWEKYSDSVYLAKVPNTFFGAYNPYAVIIDGDWYRRPVEYRVHTGQVYINGKALLEAPSADDIKTNNWYAEVKETETFIYADFGDLNPTENLVEINVRPACFEAGNCGINYITVAGFEMCHAATNWAPPTSEQTGLICANMCKGWVIENNHVHDSRCSGICIGKDKTGGDNLYSKYQRKTGYMNQLEVVLEAKRRGWSKELVGSHIIRNNRIHDCGQTGIVGHLGSAFSEVYGNHIYNIQFDDEFYGHEIAGIKFHASIDTYIHHNFIHHCRRGLWLDWQVQGVRVSSNVIFDSVTDDFSLEVSHGPQIIDNNIFGSQTSMLDASQGSAMINNLFCGTVYNLPSGGRFTPYHFPHTTDIKGVIRTYNGDNRIYNNIYLGGEKQYEGTYVGENGTAVYNEYNNLSVDEYVKDCNENSDIDNRHHIKLPIYINNNCYLAGAIPFNREVNNVVSDNNPNMCITEENGEFYLEFEMAEEDFVKGTECMGTKNMPITLFSESDFDNPDGSSLVINTDMFGNLRGENPTVGPFEKLKAGMNRILLFKTEV